jgi:hypothetical protein
MVRATTTLDETSSSPNMLRMCVGVFVSLGGMGLMVAAIAAGDWVMVVR